MMRHGLVARCVALLARCRCIAARREQEHSVQKERAIKREISPRSLQTNVKEQIPTGRREQGRSYGLHTSKVTAAAQAGKPTWVFHL